METKAKNQFNWRSFVSVLTAFSFIGLTFTGIILFVVPPGRIANWTGWTLLALTKDQWIALHDWFGIIFVVTAVIHLYFNLKLFISYFKSRVTKTFSLRSEWVVALLVCVVVGAGTVVNFAPFSTLMTWNESIKYGWDNPSQQAPIPHAELLTLIELAEQVPDANIETMIANLEGQGIKVQSPEIIVNELAESVAMTPEQIYQIALGQSTTGSSRFGQMTLKQYCEQINLDVDEAVKILNDAGFTIKPEMTIREIADSKGAHPSEIRTLLNQLNQ
ncbi:MAG: DUF4405 domain-containing protein [Sedimentisphaerales bacterium]|nr:DUF4405 domain-containing protein [Sedimentisphaerales bacterium]